MQNTTVPLMDFPTFPLVFFEEFALFFVILHASSPPLLLTYITHTLNTLFPHPSCHFLQLLTTSSLQSNTLNHSFFQLTFCPAVALVALVLAVQNPESADLLWLCSWVFFFFFFALYRCQLSLHTGLFFFSSIKDVSVCDIVARGGGGVEAKLFHLKQLKPGSIPT